MRISLKFGLVLMSLLTVALTVAAVHLPWHFFSRENVAEVVRQLNSEIVSGINREVENLFESAIAAQDMIHETLYEGVINIEEKPSRDRFFLAVLNANPNFSWVSFGKPNGDFYGVQRRDSVNLRVVESIWSAERNEARREEQYLVDDGERISRTVTKVKMNDYYTPNRSWYERAILTPGTNIWTDIYIFANSQKAGLNTAVTLMSRGEDGGNEVLTGVISIAIELEGISRYLAGLTSVRSGAAFIIDREGRLIAVKESGEFLQPVPSPEKLDLPLLKDIGDPMLELADLGLEQSSLKLQDVSGTREVMVKGENGDLYFLTLAPAMRQDWLIGTIIPERDFLLKIYKNYYNLAIAVSLAVFVVGLIVTIAARIFLVRPMKQLVSETRKIAQFDLDGVHRVRSSIFELDELSVAIEQMSRGLGSFRRYLPADLVHMLVKEGVVAELGGERRQMSIMFMDLEGFTGLSERMGHRVLPILGEYFGAMTSVIQVNRGTVDKFIGDAVMAFWGAPHFEEEHPTLVCRAALECAARMQDLRREWASRGLPELKVRIGVNSGRVLVGNIGSEDRLNYSVIGDPVNLAARLEGINRDFGTTVIISQHTYEAAKYDVVARRLDAVKIKGKKQMVEVYELLAMQDDSGSIDGFEWIPVFERGLDLFFGGRYEDAAVDFKKVIEMRGGDRPSELFLERVYAHGPRGAAKLLLGAPETIAP
ncbi:adenylate/guanylate cyclase domain-containing protein [Aquibium sp. ELW1220]|uniref:adenylate/guanylate cyclase domain-containing protein n=1 Tax=Aquibium sp. ELW1220 TaxID=2976766 RepID=UPI0025AF42D2|nr:adenylate/guanylate cyclase domain-containing protein [Aquibium sp. ELW1220]MDN2584137.1 hypothetical protein [Aquibium sp. ELW1220]